MWSSNSVLNSVLKTMRAKSAAGLRTFTAIVCIAVTVAGCGFQLRGSYELPYKAVHIAAPGTSLVASNLRRDLTNSAIKIAADAKSADAQVVLTNERRDRQILSLSGAGRVREYQLRFWVSYQVVESNGRVLIPTNEIQLTRILAYDDAQIIAKQQEEALLYTDMEKDAVGQILRRMVAVKRAS
jgi:LPS-assembly lipoprotein